MTRRPFAQRYGPWALVAGGSEGIGAAFADELGRRGVNLLLVARRQEQLDETAARLRRERAVEVVTVATDLTDLAALDEVSSAAAGLEIGLVVANAALAPAGKFLSCTEAEIIGAVDLNCRASALLAYRFLPAMAYRGHGGVILVSSLAGLQGVPNLAAYSATKAFLISLGESLWAEMRSSGVDVITACLGAVSTPGYRQAVQRPAPGTSSPALVAATALNALGRGFRVVPGGLNRVSAFALQRIAPRRAAIAIFGQASAATLKESPAPDSGPAARS
ncbi:MAG TPA: SDR family NAD(P)-dependent oxidoreductase [Streptosporangiaceae bacterium]|nr:SDR family NAD(P)-dependent oxidoreductase [Streptosporangiaceae bacterium]